MNLHSAVAFAAYLSLLSPPAQSQERAFYPGYVQRSIWPSTYNGGSNPTGEVGWLGALHFSTPLELDAMAVIGQELFLIHHPGRYDSIWSLGTGVKAAAVLPLGTASTALDAVLVSASAGLLVKHWSGPGPSFCATVGIGSSSSWSNVTRFWVCDNPGGGSGGAFAYRIFGLDAAAQVLYSVDYVPSTSGAPGSSSAWQNWGSITLGTTLRDLVFTEYTNAYAKQERTTLFSSAFLMTDFTGTSFIQSASTGSQDLIGTVPLAYPPPTNELFAWVTSFGGSATLFAGNGTANSGPAYYTLPNVDFTSMLAAPFRTGAEPSSLPCVLLPEDSEGWITVAQRSGTDVTSPFRKLAGTFDTLDTFLDSESTSSRAPITHMVTGDFDLDGDEDLLVSHESIADLTLWLSYAVPYEYARVRVLPNGIQAEPPVSGQNLTTVYFDMTHNTGAAQYTHVEVERWIDLSYQTSTVPPQLVDKEVIEVGTGNFGYEFQYDVHDSSLASDHVWWVSFTGVVVDQLGIVSRGATRNIYYTPNSTTESTLASVTATRYPTLTRSCSTLPGDETEGLNQGSRQTPGGGTGGSGGPP